MTDAQDGTLHGDIRQLRDDIKDLAVKVEQVNAKIMPRTEIEDGIASRVSLDAWQGAMDRLAKLESGPQRMIAWISLMVSGGVGCLTVLVALVGVIVTIVLNHH